MTERIAFYFDENMSGEIARGLRQIKIDVSMAVEVGMMGKTDIEHLEYARGRRLVIVTQDEDFLILNNQGLSIKAFLTTNLKHVQQNR